MKVHFTKMHGCGNDFLLIDESHGTVVEEKDRPRFARMACKRHFSVGADGVIYVETALESDVSVRFSMPDGSEAEMCGNGARCVAAYAVDKGILSVGSPFLIKTRGSVLHTTVLKHAGPNFEVEVSLGKPKIAARDVPVYTDHEVCREEEVALKGFGEVVLTAVNTGVPHAVIFDDDIDRVDVERMGRALRNLTALFPKGANVDFASVGAEGLRLRTYERGVERETLACGTGVAASVVAAYLTKRLESNRFVGVVAQGGRIDAKVVERADKIVDIVLRGPVAIAFAGDLEF